MSLQIIDPGLRTVLATANLPANNRDIIEKSLTTLKNAIDLPPTSDIIPEPEVIARPPSEVLSQPTSEGMNQPPSEGLTRPPSEGMTRPQETEVRSEAEPLQLEAWASVDTRCYDGLGAEAAEHEDRVREALGLAGGTEAMEVREMVFSYYF